MGVILSREVLQTEVNAALSVLEQDNDTILARTRYGDDKCIVSYKSENIDHPLIIALSGIETEMLHKNRIRTKKYTHNRHAIASGAVNTTTKKITITNSTIQECLSLKILASTSSEDIELTVVTCTDTYIEVSEDISTVLNDGTGFIYYTSG